MFNTMNRNARLETVVTSIAAQFTTTGDTFDSDHFLTNNSTPNRFGVAVIRNFDWNLVRPGQQSWEFDTERQYVFTRDLVGNITGFTINNAGFQFLTQNNTELATNLQFVNGSDWQNRAIFGQPSVALGFFPTYFSDLDRDLDGDRQLNLEFGPGAFGLENFVWRLDSDRAIANPRGGSLFPDDVVFANLLAGTRGSVTFEGDFDGDGNLSQVQIPGVLQVPATDPAGVELSVSANVIRPALNPDPNATGHGMHVIASGSSEITKLHFH